MSDKMNPISLKEMLRWILAEYNGEQSIFGIPLNKFYRVGRSGEKLFGETLGTPLGPAAGPHTQMAHNIAAAYLTGGRFFELKTVQVLDELKFPKPCIAAQDEGYNTEWSTELSVQQAFAEYVKAWFVLHILRKEVFHLDGRDFVFNMSIGYNLEGIQSPKVDDFIEGLKDATTNRFFQGCKDVLIDMVDQFKLVDREYIDNISPNICRSVTLSTMHGCPPSEIDGICRYLLKEKSLSTFVKMNPTLLGYSYVHQAFARMGYNYIALKEESFSHDLQYADGIVMLHGLKDFAAACGREFGVKIANTLPVQITRGELPGQEMYMSGRSLYPLAINLSYKLACEFAGDLRISYAGGVDYFNLVKIYETGIKPITMATNLLKPGGYYRLQQLAVMLESVSGNSGMDRINIEKLGDLADGAFTDINYAQHKRPVAGRKISRALPLTDCVVAPCTVGCPIGQDIPEYIRLVGEQKYEQAYAVILAQNPLPFITGTICSHYCMNKCPRLDYDDPVRIRELKLLAAEKGRQAFPDVVPPPACGQAARAAVIGAGPSGLSAAYFLARAGIEATVIDKDRRAGGTVARVIPDFRVRPEAVGLDVELIQGMGVRFELGSKEELTIEDLRGRGFRYIYLALGAGKSKTLPLTGDGTRMTSALSFLEKYNSDKKAVTPGRNVAVVGGGNTAMDAARAALRIDGVARVFIIYRRTREFMPAMREEVELALKEGAVLKELLQPVEMKQGVLRCVKMGSGDADHTGRRAPVARAGEYEDIPVDFVVSAIGEMVDMDYLLRMGLQADGNGRVKADEDTLETNLSNVFIGGDALSGPGTVVQAIADGKKVAGVIAAREHRAVPPVAGANTDRLSHASAISRKKGLIIPGGDIQGEPARCLECNYVCNMCVEVCPNRANVPIKVSSAGFRDISQILHIDGLCNQCDNCATFCPYSGAPYQDKFTLYWSEEEFENSVNDGFVLLENGAEPEVKVRLKGNQVQTRFSATGAAPLLPEDIARFIWTTITQYGYLFLS